MKKQLKPIPTYPGYYATDQGEIISYRSGSERVLSKRLHNGYYRVNVNDCGNPVRTHVEPVHKLVLETFVGKRPENYVCRHLNGNPLDNRLENICWGTQQENAQDAIRHGTAPCLRHGENGLAAKLKLNDVIKIRELYANGHSQKELASAFSITQRHVSDIINGKTWKKDAPLGEVKS